MPDAVMVSNLVQKQIVNLLTSVRLKVQEKILMLKSEPRPHGTFPSLNSNELLERMLMAVCLQAKSKS